MKLYRTNKLLAWVFAMVMVISLLPGMGTEAFAAETCTHDAYENGFCANCDAYQPADLVDGVYEISNAGQLYWFAAKVNSGGTAIHGKLTADILVNENVLTGDGALNGDGSDFRVWTPIGNSSQRYAGAFNGSGKTVSGLYTGSAFNGGLFGYVTAAGTIENVTVSDSYFSGSSNLGGIVGWNEGTVENCVNNSTIVGKECLGGVAGVSSGTVTNCANTGTVSGNRKIGGVVGSGSGTVKNCCNFGAINGTIVVGGVVGSDNSDTVTNCYYLDTTASGGISGRDVAGQAEARTDVQFASGEVAYLLGSPWGQNIDTEGTRDPYPVLNGYQVYCGYKSCGDTELQYSNGELPAEKPDHSAGAEGDKAATCAAPAYCSVCESQYGEVDKNNHEGTVLFDENGFCPNGCYEPAEEVDGVYQISNAGNLYWFADKVTNENATYGSIDAILTADITVNENVLAADGTVNEGPFRVWTPIGKLGVIDNKRVEYPYTGTFDGNGKTVSGLHFNDTSANFAVGLFAIVGESGKVQNVGIEDSYLCGTNTVGTVVGSNYGTVTDCYNTGTVSGESAVGGVVGYNVGTVTDCHNTGTVSGTSEVGGVVGYNAGTATGCHNTGTVSGESAVGGVVGNSDGRDIVGTGTVLGNAIVTDCYNTGTVSGTENVGGVVGWNYSGTCTNCYNSGNLSGTTKVGGVVGWNYSGTCTNCYFDSTVYSGDAIGTNNGTATDVEGKSTEAFASGEVAYLLGEPFGQTIGTDLYPALNGAEVYMVKFCDGVTDVYSNTNENMTHSFTDADLTCDCGAQAVARIGSDYYLHIDAAEAQWGEGETLILLADVETDDCLDAGYPDMVLELNGKTLTNTGTQAGRKTGIVVATDASLTIRDSSAAGTGAVDSQTVAVANNGELTLEGGTMLGLGVNNYRIMTMNGGKIVRTGSGTAVQNMGSLTVNGGVIQAEGDAVTNEDDVTVNGGTITGKIAISSSVSDGETVRITLGNGQVSGTSEDILLSQRAAGRFEVRLTQVPEEAYTIYINTDSYPFLFGYSSDTVAASADHWESVNTGVLVDVNADGVVYAYLCDHTGSTHTTALPSGEVHVYTCTLCGTSNLYEDHSGGTANCIDLAVCELCDGRYGELNPQNHTGVNHLERIAMEGCGTPGYTGDTVCECGALIAQGEVIPATGNHTDASDDGNHICDVCQTPDVTSHTGGTATCMAKAVCSDCDAEYGEKDPQNHTGVNHTVGAEEATCTEPGYTGDTYCECGMKVADGTVIPVTEHDFVDGECADCGAEDPDWEDPTDPTDPEVPTDPTDPTDPEDPTDPTDPEDPTDPTDPEDPTDPTDPEDPTDPTDPEDPDAPVLDGINRLSGKNRYETGFAIATKLKELKGIDKFSAVIVAYGQNFPDALTGSYLAAVKDAPILLTEPSMDADVLTFIRENVVSGGKVYILGGTAAVSQSFESGARAYGFDVQRLKGAGRYETNLEILKEAGVNATDEILIATGKNYADSLSASATGLPMLLVDKVLTDAQKTFLADTSKQFVILGGTGAVSAEVEAELDAIGDVTRVKGASRYSTSVEIAKRYFTAPDAVVLAYAEGFPDGLCGGPLAYCIGAPLILTSNENYPPADAYVVGIERGAVTGGSARISDETVREIFDLPADTPIVKP